MNVVNYFNTNIFSGLVRQLKLYIKQKAVTAADSDKVNFKKLYFNIVVLNGVIRNRDSKTKPLIVFKNLHENSSNFCEVTSKFLKIALTIFP